MRQVWITKTGAPDVLQVREGPELEPGPGEVRVAVQAIGVNFADVMGRLGIYPDAPRGPFVPGYEVAGTIDAVGAGVEAAQIGTDVLALTRFGGYADQVCVPAEQVLPRPANMTVEQAAGFPVAFLTAYVGLVALAGLKPGERVLIQAAAGGLGLAAVGLARRCGATIYGTASASKHDFLRERGVQYPIDYRHEDFERAVARLTDGQGVHVALDTIGGRSWLKSYRALGPGGRLVISGVSSMAPGQRRSVPGLIRFALGVPWLRFNPVSLANDNKGVLGVNMGRLWERRALLRSWIETVLAWYSDGQLDVHIDRTFPLEDAAAAHRYLQERRNIGKVVLKP